MTNSPHWTQDVTAQLVSKTLERPTTSLHAVPLQTTLQQQARWLSQQIHENPLLNSRPVTKQHSTARDARRMCHRGRCVLSLQHKACACRQLMHACMHLCLTKDSTHCRQVPCRQLHSMQRALLHQWPRTVVAAGSMHYVLLGRCASTHLFLVLFSSLLIRQHTHSTRQCCRGPRCCCCCWRRARANFPACC